LLTVPSASSRWYSLTATWRQAASSSASSSAVPLSRLSETFADGTSGAYVEDMYRAWKRDADSVHASWASYFRSVDAGRAPGEAFTAPPTLRGATSAAPAGSLPPPHTTTPPRDDGYLEGGGM
jgi:2-oxoglutarate dehydrogenase E1 component